MTRPITFYTHPISGNAHRVELTLRALDLPFEPQLIDLRAKEQKTGAYLALNPFGQVPVIKDGDTVIYDSVAILTYLGLTYDKDGRWLPRDPKLFSEIMMWLAKTAGPVSAGLATARRINLFNAPADLTSAQTIGSAFMTHLNTHLTGRDWLVGDSASLADLALYGYVAHAPEGGVSLTAFSHVTSWLERIEALPFFTPMPRSKVGLWAEQT
ncbi:MAG: glutathione S-transferase N-terminal domain-containing protein [Asticcacaulis sp.]